MKILIIGLGSMGKRRIRNLQYFNIKQIYGFDINPSNVREAMVKYKIKILNSLDGLFAYGFDLVLICTPPDHHLEYVKICVKNKISFFTELNLLTQDTKKISDLIKKNKIKGYPSNTEFFDQNIISLKKLIHRNFKGYFLFHLGQNIKDWHPWQPAGEHFIFYKNTNGLREILRIELPWLIKLFGPVVKFKVDQNAFFTTKYQVNDFICLSLEFANGVHGVLVFDLISSKVIKEFRLISDKENIIWNEIKNSIIIDQANKQKKINLSQGSIYPGYKFREDGHVSEIKRLLADVRKNKRPEYDFEDELQLLKLIDRIESLTSDKFKKK
ncbi:MAG: Gfo/Idh/MocA family oxidoreductase [Candidatus Buchananbacteria bacterium]